MSDMIYAIGDVHGHFTQLKRLYDKIVLDIYRSNYKRVTVVFLGDYIDRGPKSKEVLDFLMALEDGEVINHIFLIGNHEELMVQALELRKFSTINVWLGNGGVQTLSSFGLLTDHLLNTPVPDHMIPYIDWIKFNTQELYVEGGCVFVHAAYDVTKAADDQMRERLLWGRYYPNTSPYKECEYKVIHGHTISNGPYTDVNEIGVDTGVFLGKDLTAVKISPTNVDDYEFISEAYIKEDTI